MYLNDLAFGNYSGFKKMKHEYVRDVWFCNGANNTGSRDSVLKWAILNEVLA